MTMRHATAVVLLLTLFAGGTSEARGQTPRLVHRDLGLTLTAVGDLDGDGVGDLGGTTRGVTSGFAGPGKATLISGRDGQVLYQFTNHTPISMSLVDPHISACGDADGDGVPDFALSSAGISLVSGADFTLIRTYQGARFAGVGDVDGDGRGDLAVSIPPPGPGPGIEYVSVYSGADGSVLLLFPILFSGPVPSVVRELARADDVDGDGTPDIAVRNTDASGTGPVRLRVYSGHSGLLIYERDDLPVVWGGPTVTPAGDMDGDGRGELFVATAIPGQAGVLLSGRNGATLHTYFEPQFPAGAGAVTAPDDIDRDGVLDVVFSAVVKTVPPYIPGRVTVCSGAGIGDFAVGTSGNFGSNTTLGTLIYSSRSQPSEIIGLVYAARLTLSVTGPLQADTLVTARVANGTPDNTAFMLVGPALMVPPPSLYYDLIPSGGIVFPVALDGSGRAELTARWPAGVPSGMTLYAEAFEPISTWCEGSTLVRMTAP